MFQSFDVLSDPSQGLERVSALRVLLEKRNLAGFVVPRGDEHMNEYVAPYAERLAWLTGFTGSAGIGFVLRNRAVLFVDGRYKLQVREQVCDKVFDFQEIPFDKPSDWLKENLKKGDRLAFDPQLHTQETIERICGHLKKVGAKLVPVKKNLVDLIWEDQPERPLGKIWLHPQKYSGETTSKKLERIRDVMEEDAVVLTLPDSIAWAFNIRGADVPHTPLPLSFAIIRANAKAELFIDKRKLSGSVIKSLEKKLSILEPDQFEARLMALTKKSVRVDDETASYWVVKTLKKAGAKLVAKEDPCIALKAVKNDTEIAGARNAHLRDGVAFCRFLAWLDTRNAISSIDEISAAVKLEGFRRETGQLRDISFDTISGFGKNGAIVHYRVNTKSNRRFKRGSLYLVDSGGQYEDGTTDITRTLAVGSPTREMRRRYTQVLKAHIALAKARFPKNTRGQDLDPLVRAPLWAAGIDFDHGTGHGVGSFLSVHEGPQRISRSSDVALEPGMILSNEPGYYKSGAFGIRIENLVLVTQPSALPDGEKEMMGFETLTLAPYERSLIDVDLLTAEELAWINTYHARVLREIAPHLDPTDRAWLKKACNAK